VRGADPDRIIRTFPGPAHAPRTAADNRLCPQSARVRTILKPTAGLTPDLVGSLVAEAARCRLFMFVKEDENLYPTWIIHPRPERVRRAVAAVERARDERGVWA